MKKIENSEQLCENITLDIDSDCALMCQVAEGSQHAFRMIVEKWQKPLMNYFFRSCNDVYSSQDMAQLTFVNLYKARQTYANYILGTDSDKPKAKFSTYLFSIARNVLISEHRKNVRRPADVSDPFEMEYSDDSDTHSDLKELEEIFYKTVETLPENQRTAILLLKQQELSYEEIADIMQANLQSVKTWIHRARISLRDALKKANTPNSQASR
ncbi:MAG: RNA polymerase sigma factor [Opitutales bacterium]|nr:RNA polymerase sigma factor [Opitutales bacterium]MBQ2721697.1 RNA polymerase sigma factor [Opitutales bacterium]